MANDIAQRITALTELAKGIPESLLAAVDDPNSPGKKTKKLGFGTFLKTYNRSAAEISENLSNDDLDFKEDEGNISRYGENTIPSTTDMTIALNNMFKIMAQGIDGFLRPESYRATTKLILPNLSNVTLWGTSGKSEIISSVGTTGDYAVLLFGNLSKVIFWGIRFKSDHVNAVLENGAAFLSDQKQTTDTKFLHCEWSVPSANTQAVAFWPRTDDTQTSGFVDGLWFEDNRFEDIGGLGCTILNRNTVAVDRFDACKNIHFNKNTGKNLGLSGTNGFLLSLDGIGSAFSVNFNHVENALNIGLENAGEWNHGAYIGNTFSVFTRSYRPMSFSNSITSNPMVGVTVAFNKTVEIASLGALFFDMKECAFSSNRFETDGGDGVSYRDIIDCSFEADKYIAAGAAGAAMLVDANTLSTGNRWHNCLFDLSGSSAGNAPVVFSGANTHENIVVDSDLRQGATGLYINEVTSAANNLLENCSKDGTLLGFSNFDAANYTVDADKTADIGEYSANALSIRDTTTVLTTGRNFLLPTFKKSWTIKNETLQTITVKHSATAGIAIATLKTAVLYSDGITVLRATADA